MKKLIFLLLAGLFIMLQEGNASAPEGVAEAIFTASPHDRILVILNNQAINRTPTQKVMIRSRPGTHKIQIRVYNQLGRLTLVHHDRIRIPPKSRNQFILETYPGGRSRLVAFNHPYHKRVMPKRVAPHSYSHSSLRLMQDEEFQRLLFSLQQLPNDRKRMVLAKRALQNQYVYSEDVKEMMRSFSFEANRLAFSKLAYRRVVDPEHFEVVFDAFRCDSSIYQLEDYIIGAGI